MRKDKIKIRHKIGKSNPYLILIMYLRTPKTGNQVITIDNPWAALLHLSFQTLRSTIFVGHRDYCLYLIIRTTTQLRIRQKMREYLVRNWSFPRKDLVEDQGKIRLLLNRYNKIPQATFIRKRIWNWTPKLTLLYQKEDVNDQEKNQEKIANTGSPKRKSGHPPKQSTAEDNDSFQLGLRAPEPSRHGMITRAMGPMSSTPILRREG
jgi:hypothetical protein